ncbi:MAG: response regulator [Chitinispirillales bacterium]|jgi:signal transduction histidine kinase/DNA-binding response OmpR family regulator|nr:response regulator [Chitinispirillales bacterium]
MSVVYERRSAIVAALNKTIEIFLSYSEEMFEELMTKGLQPIADAAELDRIGVYRYKNMIWDMGLEQVYRWDRELGGTTKVVENANISYQNKAAAGWFKILSTGNYINTCASEMSEDQLSFTDAFDVKSIMIVPIFTQGELWGIVTLQNHKRDRRFDKECIDLLLSSAYMCANAIIREEAVQNANKAAETLEYRKKFTDALNRTAIILLSQSEKSFEDMMTESVRVITDLMDLDRLSIWRNFQTDEGLHTSQIYRWDKISGGSTAPTQGLENISYARHAPRWEKSLSYGEIVNGPISELPYSDILKSFDVVSAVIMPVFMYNAFWGFVLFEDRAKERYFDDDYINIMRPAAFLYANATVREEMERKITAANKQREEAFEQALSASRAKGEFLSKMSHEIRTPLNAITGMTAIGKNANDMQRIKHALNKIEDASTHLLGVINDILDMSKIEANKMELSPVEFSFERMLQKVVTIVSFRMDEKQLKFSVNIDKNVPRFIIGDDQRLAQVITNLLSNSIKFTPKGGRICLDAYLSWEKDSVCELRIEVSDSGIGISHEQQKKLFHAFEQAESGTNRKFGGTGLGLAISKRIVELMGGAIWIESKLGKGAKFIFTVKADCSEKNLSALLDPNINCKETRVLAVGDMEETRDYLKDLFDGLNIRCDRAVNGSEAFRIIEEHGDYDIYFIGWKMPDIDTVGLAKKIKSRAKNNPSVVTTISAVEWTEIKGDSLDDSIDKYLIKPLFSTSITDCVNECLVKDKTCHDEADKEHEFSGKKLLVAEDVDINREIIISLLDNTGLIIDCAENGKIALDMIETAPDEYDLVLMDVQMPEMDGLEATKRIRALPNLAKRKLPIIAMTANVFKENIEECLAAGMDSHIGKPLDIDDVMEKLRKYLKTSGSE